MKYFIMLIIQQGNCSDPLNSNYHTILPVILKNKILACHFSWKPFCTYLKAVALYNFCTYIRKRESEKHKILLHRGKKPTIDTQTMKIANNYKKCIFHLYKHFSNNKVLVYISIWKCSTSFFQCKKWLCQSLHFLATLFSHLIISFSIFKM